VTDYQSFDLVVIYADIVGSTKIVSKLPEKQIPVFYSIFSNEVIKVIADFGGTVYKSVGDEIIGIFPVPETGWIPRIDDSIHCAHYIKAVTKYSISPLAESISLPKIQCRIGVDYGEAQIVNIGVKGIFLSAEILGHIMNIAAKILTQAQPDEITIGENLYQQLHVSYKLKCKELAPLKIEDLEYRVFRLDV
jgi:class 3 adenylate cyclase